MILNQLPGLVILIFGMLSLHYSVRLIDGHRRLLEFYQEKSQQISELEESYNSFQSNVFIYVNDSSAGNEKRIRDSFRSFSDVYLQAAEKMGRGYDKDKSDKYIKILESIGAKIPAMAQILKELESTEKSSSTATILSSIEPVHKEIDRLWTVLYSEEEGHSISRFVEKRESKLYWSVVVMGLSGFLLVMLNSSKYRQLKIASEEKKKTLKMLEDRIAAIESTYEGIGIVDSEGRLRFMNRALRGMHGIADSAAEEFIGQSWLRLYDEKERQVIEKEIMPVLSETGNWHGEFSITKKSGEVIEAEISFIRLPDGGIIGTARDITDKKIAERENELLQSQFYQAQKMEAVGRLAGGIAHDFNNILAAMNGNAEFLIEDLDEKTPQHGFARNILQAGRQARDLIDQMLAFSRRESSNFMPVDLRDSLDECLLMLKASLPKTIEVKSRIELESAPVNGNSTQISQLVMNLCLNATDAMEGERGQLQISLRHIDPCAFGELDIVQDDLPGIDGAPPTRIEDAGPDKTRLLLGLLSRKHQYACLMVQDAGCGMSRVIMEHIFEPFFTTKPVDKGTGLGLSTVHGVIVSHQCAMIVESILRKGTKFEIFFPLIEDPAASVRKEERDLQEDVYGRILLVEDQEEVREMMVNMLERMGYEAYAVDTGLEALAVIKENPAEFDLVVTDHNMPKMTGFELVYQANLVAPDLPFIMVSGYSQQKLQELMAEHDAIKAIIRKPVSRNALQQKIQDVLREKQPGKAGSS